ncbi:MAG TPA: hypothetical protein VNS46_07245 [Nocardioides sp.]|nr:hypothetical protein [Nocardioides sp.]
MHRLKTALTVLGAVTVLLLAGNTLAYAATGKPLLLGSSNYAGKQTSLARTTNGPVLNLRARSSSSAPLTTNGRGKVTNLNADKVDGLDAAALRTQSRVFRTTFQGAFQAEITLPLAPGTYLVSYALHAETESDAPIGIICWILEDGPDNLDQRVAWDSAELSKAHLEHAVSGNGLVTKTPSTIVKLQCEAPDGEIRTGDVPVQVVVTPTTRLSQQVLPAKVEHITPF